MDVKLSKYYEFLSKRTFFLLLCLIPFLTSCDRSKTIVNGLEEKEANEIVVLLSTKNIEATKVQSDEGTGGGGAQKVILWNIAVPEQSATQAMSVLNNAGLPRTKGQNLLNIFSNTGLVPTDMAEKIRYQAGLASQIASTIRNIDGVLDADVLISFPEQDPLNPTAPKKDITASVYVKHSGVLDDPNTHLITKIKNLVTSSISGLKYENVTLIPDRARLTDLPTGGCTFSDSEDQMVRVWTMHIDKDSVTLFRVIFFSFCILILLMTVAVVWICWKTFPLLKPYGGVKELLNFKPTVPKESLKKENEDEEEPVEEEEEKEGEDESFVDESADFGGDIDISEEER